jgi:hypothetical protein
MAIFHSHIQIITRGKGKSAIAAAAYRAAEAITNEIDGTVHDYTRKRGIAHKEIILPSHAPSEYSDRSVLWNAVEKIEKAENSQLARELDIALPVELTMEENISLARRYVQEQFVNFGMCADLCVHDTKKGNPHFHVMLTMRPINDDGSWGSKQKKEYILDEGGNKIYDPAKRQYKCRSIPSTDWNNRANADKWREAWEDLVNEELKRHGSDTRIDRRTYEEQGVEKIPTVHMGAAASQMERKGIRTERGAINRQVEITNREIRQLKARLNKLKNWLAEEAENIAPPTLADVISEILSRDGQSKITRLKNASQMLLFLQENQIMDFAGLEKKVSDMFGKLLSLGDELKPINRRIATLDEHIKQAKIYLEYKNDKALSDTERILFTAAKKYLDEHLNGHKLDLKKWKAERAEKAAERNQLNQKYNALKEEIKKVEQIRREVYDIMRSEQQGQKKEKTKDEVR